MSGFTTWLKSELPMISGLVQAALGTVNAAIVFLASLLVRQHVSPSSPAARTMLRKYSISPAPGPAPAAPGPA